VTYTREAQLLGPDGELSGYVRDEVLGYFARGVRGTRRGAGGLPLVYRAFPAAPGATALVLVPGRSEPVVKYAELIYDLRDAGYAIYALDHRGQGESGRLVAPSTRGYVDDFQRYVDDLHAFVATVVRPAAPRVVALGHSMGGAIATSLAAQHRRDLDALVLAAPMLQIAAVARSPLPARLARLAVAAGAGALAVPGKPNVLTSSPARDQLRVALERAFPATVVAEPSFRWVDQAIAGAARARAHVAAIRVPVLLLRGLADQVVDGAAQDAAVAAINAAGGDARAHLFPDAAHELFQERDAIRDEAIAVTLRFLAATTTREPAR
jgi:lysophospholipase